MSTEPEASQSLAGGSALLLLAQVAGNAGFFVAVLILARALTVAERGDVAFLTVTALVVGRIVDIGVPETATIFAARRPQKRPELLTSLTLFTLVTAAAGGVVVALGLAALKSVRPAAIHTPELVALAAGVVGAAVFGAALQFHLGLERYREQTIVRTLVPWLYAALVGGLWAAGSLTVLRAMLAWVAAHSIGGMILLAVSARRTGFGRFDWPYLRAVVAYGTRAWAGTLTRFLNFRTDQVLMGFISSQAELGIYSVAVNLSEVLLYLPNAVGNAMLPTVSRGARSERAQQSLRCFRVLTLVTAAAVAVAALVGAPLLPVLFGHKFDGSVAPFLWLLPGAFGYVGSMVFSSALLAGGQPGGSSLGSAVSLVVGFALDLALIPPYGAVGAAIAASAAFGAGGLAAAVAYRRHAAFGVSALVPWRSEVSDLRLMLRRPPWRRAPRVAGEPLSLEPPT